MAHHRGARDFEHHQPPARAASSPTVCSERKADPHAGHHRLLDSFVAELISMRFAGVEAAVRAKTRSMALRVPEPRSRMMKGLARQARERQALAARQYMVGRRDDGDRVPRERHRDRCPGRAAGVPMMARSTLFSVRSRTTCSRLLTASRTRTSGWLRRNSASSIGTWYLRGAHGGNRDFAAARPLSSRRAWRLRPRAAALRHAGRAALDDFAAGSGDVHPTSRSARRAAGRPRARAAAPASRPPAA